MPQKISADIVRRCKLCGQEFHPKARKQFCCGEMKPRKCVYCGQEFMAVCSTSNDKKTCSKECSTQYAKISRAQSLKQVLRTCKWCGKQFTPSTAQQVYCHEVHYQTCSVCGKQFEIDPRIDSTVKTCSSECRYKQMVDSQDKEAIVANLKQTMLIRYGVENPMQIEGVVDKMKQTNLERYGTEWYTQTDEYKQRVEETDLVKYGVKHHLQSEDVIAKRVDTVQNKYGAHNIFSSEYGKMRVKQALQDKYGVINPSQHPEFKSKATKSARNSKLEERIFNVFLNYGIEVVPHHFISSGDLSHEFDFYIPRYKLLIDADGLYFHSYLDDPDGVRVRDDYDEVRLSLVPEGFIFHVIVENNEDAQIKELISTLESADSDVTRYNSRLFEWCRSIDFPYPEYSDKRIFNDWKHLQDYTNDQYVPQCRLGLSAIKQFHKSIYSCHVGNNMSPLEGWNDDNKLKQVIRNRLIYKNTVDPSKILAGFNISKICPCVSIFNPVLARYLTLKYLNEYDEVFDPFSGFSGRLMGVSSCNKHYIGQDINPVTVEESNRLSDMLSLPKVTEKDVLESTGTHQCLLTCPPYSNKEVYGQETVFKTCDEWIDECLKRFDCKRYVFVVDNTTKYADCIREEIKSSSHISSVSEYVVVIDSELKSL